MQFFHVAADSWTEQKQSEAQRGWWAEVTRKLRDYYQQRAKVARVNLNSWMRPSKRVGAEWRGETWNMYILNFEGRRCEGTTILLPGWDEGEEQSVSSGPCWAGCLLQLITPSISLLVPRHRLLSELEGLPGVLTPCLLGHWPAICWGFIGIHPTFRSLTFILSFDYRLPSWWCPLTKFMQKQHLIFKLQQVFFLEKHHGEGRSIQSSLIRVKTWTLRWKVQFFESLNRSTT